LDLDLHCIAFTAAATNRVLVLLLAALSDSCVWVARCGRQKQDGLNKKIIL
jgi:hypothetical protein